VRNFFTGVLLALALVSVSGQAAAQYVKSTQAAVSGKDDIDLSKSEWTVQLKDKQLVIDSRGKSIVNGKQITFTTDYSKTDYVSGVEYIVFDNWVLLSVGYENSDTTYAAYFRLDASLTTQPSFLAYSSGMGVNQFLSNGKNIFEATQFCFRLYAMDAKKDLWLNKDSIGSDYHYKNIVTYLGNDVVRIEYMHTVDSAQKFESIKLSLKDGTLISK